MNFLAVGAWYEDFQPVADAEVRRLLADAQKALEHRKG
jgi:predicted phosphoribosyltransferase